MKKYFINLSELQDKYSDFCTLKSLFFTEFRIDIKIIRSTFIKY